MRRAGALVFGVLAAIAAVGLFGPLAGIATAWLLMSPDAVASTTRGGGAGAAAAAATAAGDYLREEWRAGAPARQRRRTARRDRWWEAGGWRRDALRLEHGVVLAWRAARSAWIAATRALAVIPAGARAGAAAARDHRNATPAAPTDPGGPADPGAGGMDGRPPGEPGVQLPGPLTPDPPAPAPAPTPVAGDGPSGPADSGGRPAAGPAPRTGDDMPENSNSSTQNAPGSGELQTTADLRAEAEQIAAVIEEATILAGMLRDWQHGLPEAYTAGQAAGGPRTRALDEAVSAVSEAAGDAVALAEALNLVRRACDQADSLGEQASAMGAGGHTQGYVPA